MKENSIEEDIKTVENYLENSAINEIDSNFFKNSGWETVDLEIPKSMQHILSDYKRVLKMNEVLLKENEELKIKNNAIKRESEAYAENMIRLDNELNLEKEKSKYEWIRQNCLPQELVNKLYIPVQKVKDKIEELKQKRKRYGNFIDKNECFNIESKISVLQELLEGRK